MSGATPIAALRVANEAFLVASTIERCPKTMMLRELVMNALEAADRAPAGAKLVRIGTKLVDGVAKLAIWNTGPGMSAAELHKICDLASSLRKESGLDKNFGMGAKVASLPSNKLGVRYRSCRDGAVSEVMLVQRDGIYGRHRYDNAAAGVAGEVADVTQQCTFEGGYDLSFDWTEVVLLGNRPAQNTAVDPYDNDPSVNSYWVSTYLSQRFFRLPPGVALTFPSERPDETPVTFMGIADRIDRFDRCQSISVMGNIRIHYGYVDGVSPAANKSAASDLPEFTGLAAIVHRGELYALRGGSEWLLDAPLYGFPFGARNFSIFVELPDDYGVRPEVYRQFLRFSNGDQRQVYLKDFAALVRDARPEWVREIIASYGPPQVDYLGEVTSELQALLVQLGVVAEHRQLTPPRGMERAPATPAAETRTPKPPASTTFEKPPEIICLHDPALIDERDLQGRAGRYYGASHQLFINLTYSAVSRLKAQLELEFEAAPDVERREQVAQELSEWVVTRQVARALAHTLAKKSAGWQPEEVSRSQSPEALSIVADDCLALLGPVRRRMAETLGVPLPGEAEALATSGQAIWAARSAAELADAQQAARKALLTPTVNPVPILLRLSSIEAQRGNLPAAHDWAQKAIAARPSDAHPHSHLADLLQRQGSLEEAEDAVRTAIELSSGNSSRFLIQHSSIVAQRGDLSTALDLARQAVTADPAAILTHHHLSILLTRSGFLDEAEDAAREGLELGNDNPARLLRQLSSIEAQRGNLPAALDQAQLAIEADPSDAWNFSHLANLFVQQRAFDEAAQAVHQALGLHQGNPANFLRQVSSIEAQRGNLAAALDWARQSLDVNPGDPVSYQHLSGLLQQNGELDEAEQIARTGLDRVVGNPSRLLRQLSSIEAQRQNLAAALDLARQSLDADPGDPVSHQHLSGLLQQNGELDEAEQVVRAGLDRSVGNPSRLMRQLSSIEAQRRNLAAALGWARQSLDADPADPVSYQHLSGLLQQNGELDEAEQVVRAGLDRRPADPSRLLRQLSSIEAQRRNLAAALDWARQSLEANPRDSSSYHHLSALLQQNGELDEAERVARAGLEVNA